MEKRTGYRILHLILAAIILLNILDFLEMLDPFWDYVKKLVSIVLGAALFYHLSPSKILLGAKKKLLDWWFVTGALLLTIDSLTHYMSVMREHMLANAADYFMFAKGGVATMSQNVSEASWNALTNLGVVPEAPARLQEVAANVTAGSAPTIAFGYGGETLTYSVIAQGLNGSLLTFYNTIAPYTGLIEQWSILLGAALLLGWSFFAAITTPVHDRSFVGLIDRGSAQGVAKVLARSMIIFCAITFFFLFLFSLVMEWLAIAVDAPIVMIAIMTSLILLITHKVRFSWSRWEEWVIGIGSNVKPLIELFQQKKTVLLGISGLLVLHVASEVLNYLLPFTLPMRDSLYLSQLGPGHENLFSLASTGPEVAVAILNLLAWLFILAMPAYIWYKLYLLRSENHPRHHPQFSWWVLGLASGSFTALLLAPMIWFRRVSGDGLIGVDFYTRAYETSWLDPMIVLLASLGVLVVISTLSIIPEFKRFLYLIPLLASLLFLAAYSLLYFLSASTYHLSVAVGAASAGLWGLSTIFTLFLLFNALFYASGYLFFLYEIGRD